MRFKIILLTAIFCLFLNYAFSQISKSSKERVHFRSSFLAGVLEGEKGGYFQMQLINGIKYKTMFAGIGIGLDHYYIRSVPIVLQIEKDFSAGPSRPYLYGNAGLNIPWATNNQEQTGMKSNWISEFGLGYKFPISSKNLLFFNAGYEIKHLRQIVPGWPVTSDPQFYYLNYDQHYSYTFRMLSVKAGISF